MSWVNCGICAVIVTILGVTIASEEEEFPITNVPVLRNSEPGPDWNSGLASRFLGIYDPLTLGTRQTSVGIVNIPIHDAIQTLTVADADAGESAEIFVENPLFDKPLIKHSVIENELCKMYTVKSLRDNCKKITRQSSDEEYTSEDSSSPEESYEEETSLRSGPERTSRVSHTRRGKDVRKPKMYLRLMKSK